jgi:tetratricopeptide (TPR) repeat protein
MPSYLAEETKERVAKARLDSWKSIAEYLKRSPRTVQRWQADLGLPVHHFGGGQGPAFAYEDELDAWLSGLAGGAVEEQSGGDEALDALSSRSSDLTSQADALWVVHARQNLGAIARLYRSAIELNPGNAPAHVGLANSIILAALLGVMRGSAAYPRAAEALRRASHLHFDAPELRCATAWLQMVHERNWRQARDGFEDVLRKQPRSSHALAGQGLLCAVNGNLREASLCLHEAWKLNAFNSTANALYCWVEYLSGNYHRALEIAAESRASGEFNSLCAASEAFAFIQTARPGQNLLELEETARLHAQSAAQQGALGYVCAVAGQESRAREIMDNLPRMGGDSEYAIALVLIGLKERQQAIPFLEASFAEGSLWSLGFRSDPLLQPLRDDLRFASLLKKLETTH